MFCGSSVVIRRRWLPLIYLLLSVFLFLRPLAMVCLAQDRQPMSIEEIISLVQQKVSRQRTVELIEKHGVGFEVNERVLHRLRQAGASEDIVIATSRMGEKYKGELQKRRETQTASRRGEAERGYGREEWEEAERRGREALARKRAEEEEMKRKLREPEAAGTVHEQEWEEAERRGREALARKKAAAEEEARRKPGEEGPQREAEVADTVYGRPEWEEAERRGREALAGKRAEEGERKRSEEATIREAAEKRALEQVRRQEEEKTRQQQETRRQQEENRILEETRKRQEIENEEALRREEEAERTAEAEREQVVAKRLNDENRKQLEEAKSREEAARRLPEIRKQELGEAAREADAATRADLKNGLIAPPAPCVVGQTLQFQHGDGSSFGREISAHEDELCILGTDNRSYYDQNWVLVKLLSSKGEPIPASRVLEPSIGEKWLDFPLWVGKTWQDGYGVQPSERVRTSWKVFTVISYEEISVRAGVYKTFKIKQEQHSGFASGVRYFWYAPEVGYYVKRQTAPAESTDPSYWDTLSDYELVSISLAQ